MSDQAAFVPLPERCEIVSASGVLLGERAALQLRSAYEVLMPVRGDPGRRWRLPAWLTEESCKAELAALDFALGYMEWGREVSAAWDAGWRARRERPDDAANTTTRDGPTQEQEGIAYER